MKGVSPIIAAVLLIVFTIIIASILASFATTLSQQQLATAGEEAACIGALDISSVSYDSTTDTLNFRIRNAQMPSIQNLTLVYLTAAVEFINPVENIVFNSTLVPKFISINPAETKFVSIDLSGQTSNPIRIEVVASNCPRNGAVMELR